MDLRAKLVFATILKDRNRVKIAEKDASTSHFYCDLFEVNRESLLAFFEMDRVRSGLKNGVQAITPIAAIILNTFQATALYLFYTFLAQREIQVREHARADLVAEFRGVFRLESIEDSLACGHCPSPHLSSPPTGRDYLTSYWRIDLLITCRAGFFTRLL